MKVVGLITEYNPFHNGHKYHIEEAKRITGADYVIVVMSGNFVQRGTPAMIDKYSRTRMALNNGADLVLELPVYYATSSAEFFALGAVSLLDKLGVIDYLCFGSECGDIELLKNAADFLCDPPVSFEFELQHWIKKGLTFPAARLKALECTLNSNNTLYHHKDLSSVFIQPNNILGIEYLKALHNISSTINPITIQRKSAHYHDKLLSSKDGKAHATASDKDIPAISSATAIRHAITIKTDSDHRIALSNVEENIPKDVYRFIMDHYHRTFPITEEDFSEIMKYKLLSEDKASLIRYVDITNDLADRLKNINNYNLSIKELGQNIKTKNLTLTRINRALIHLLLNITKNNFEEYKAHGYVPYGRILGIKKESSHLIRRIEKNGRIPIITKVSKASEKLNKLEMRMLKEDILASHIYNQAVYDKFQTSIPNEYKIGIVII